MFNLLYWLFGFLRMGSSGLTAQAFGANDKVRQATVLYQALTVAPCYRSRLHNHAHATVRYAA